MYNTKANYIGMGDISLNCPWKITVFQCANNYHHLLYYFKSKYNY